MAVTCSLDRSWVLPTLSQLERPQGVLCADAALGSESVHLHEALGVAQGCSH